MKKPIEKTPYVFVYGTLMKGLWNNYLLERDHFVSEAATEQPYVLYASVIPYLVEEDGGKHVSGEIYKVSENTLKNVDTLEGSPDWYERKAITVINDVGDKVFAWTYFMSKDNMSGPVTKVESGDFRDHVENTLNIS